MSIKTGKFIKLYKIWKIIQDNLFFFFFTGDRGIFGTQWNIYSRAFLRNITAKNG